MAGIIASPCGVALPYSSIFDVNLRNQSTRPLKSKRSSFYWEMATQPSHPRAALGTDVKTADDDADDVSFLSDCENDENLNPIVSVLRYRKNLRLKFRKITFKAFTPKSDGTSKKSGVVRTTEILTRQGQVKPPRQNGLSNSNRSPTDFIFKSLKFKAKSGGAQLQKMVVVLKRRISASSPIEDKPQTWEEYRYLYSHDQIDVHNPPLPPMEPAKDGEKPTPFQSRFFSAPQPSNNQARQLVLNRLGILGKKGYDATPEGAAMTVARYQLGDKLLQEGKTPSSLDMPWESPNSYDSSSFDVNTPGNRVVSAPSSPPETLEQHPVFRKIVQKCRELFQVSIAILSILDDSRQIFLAETGIDDVPLAKGLRDIPLDISFCAHTVLSGRKGFTVLDTRKDWRFDAGPLAQHFGVRFYSGVPLMAPNLDGSEESEQNSCPIGTLCLLDLNPRDSFNSEDRKKLVYLSEYARRQIESWFAKKMQHKMTALAASQETWKQELSRTQSCATNDLSSMEPEILSDAVQSNKVSRGSRRTFGSFRSSSSVSQEQSSRSSHSNHSIRAPMKTGPGIFEDVNTAIKPNMRRVFELAIKLVAETLDLSLVYLSAAVPGDESTQAGRTVIIAGHNIPAPVPAFDTGLHLKALRTPEGGLLYQNPSVEESEKDGLQPKGSELGHSNSYASAMLLAVSPEAHLNAGGFILAGYTNDPTRVFGAEDVTYMKHFAHELSRYTSKLRF